MDYLQALKRRVRKLMDVLRPRISGEGEIIPPATGVSIPDGVDYSLPVLLPRWMQQHLKPEELATYVQETTRANLHFQFDAPYNNESAIPAITEDPLREWNWATREVVLSKTHAAFHRNPLARAGVRYTAAFVVGGGFNLTTRNPDVERVLNEFIDHPDNAIREYERQAVIDLQVDGELMLRFFEGAGQVVMVPQRPWECQWIRTEKGFFRRPITYHFQRQITEGDAPDGNVTETDDVNADEILHVAVNRHGYELRGRPDLYAVLPWLKAYKDWMEDRARQNHWRGSLLWLVRVAASASGIISAVRARWRRPPTPGSVAVESDKVTVEAITNPVAADDAKEDGRQMKLMVAVGMGLPEYMLADGENANLASSTNQQLPALTNFEDYQRIMIEQVWYPVLRRVIMTANDAELLEMTVQEHDSDGDPLTDDVLDVNGNPTGNTKPRMIKAVDAFDVSYSPLGEANKLTLAQALQIAKTEGWVDDETATNELGFDYAIVRKRLRRQAREVMRDRAAGDEPTPPGDTPDGYDTEDAPMSANGRTAQVA